jgi:hypothetical protein
VSALHIAHRHQVDLLTVLISASARSVTESTGAQVGLGSRKIATIMGADGQGWLRYTVEQRQLCRPSMGVEDSLIAGGIRLLPGFAVIMREAIGQDWLRYTVERRQQDIQEMGSGD